MAEQGTKKKKLQVAVIFLTLPGLPTQPWFVSQCKRLQFRAVCGMTHEIFCWGPSAISSLEYVQFDADCILHVMEETVFSALYLGFGREIMCFLASLLLLCSSLLNQSAFILQNSFPYPTTDSS